jgi:choline dehydrogenase-like flavoprotein
MLAPLLPLARPVLMRVLEGMGRRLILASIMEDLPFPDNAVRPVEDGAARLEIRYRIRPFEKARIEAFRDRVASALKGFRFDLIRQAENNHRIAHACGTCRFGDDPGSSVLDRWNRAHGLRNLYVLDASFFPSSGGTNPALTIAANAMRVADHLCEEGP